MTEAVFVLSVPSLAVTEIMYDPPSGSLFEFIELYNPSDTAVDLRKISFSAGVEFDFADASIETLGPGEHLVLVNDLESFSLLYDTSEIKVAGEYGGNLSWKARRSF